jgi:3-hydroxyisobutyrate dehydrogenase-like beta-hydroxyacid dehydrogenase
MFEDVGARFVDGDLIGGPPGKGRSPTRLFLSGPHAAEAAAILETAELQPTVVGGPLTAASSLKMAYATWSKGSSALALAARCLARSLGVEQVLLDEWSRSQPDAVSRCEMAAGGAGRGWRFQAEMEEIASSHRAVGLPGGFGEAAAEIYGRLNSLKDHPGAAIDDVIELIVNEGSFGQP